MNRILCGAQAAGRVGGAVGAVGAVVQAPKANVDASRAPHRMRFISSPRCGRTLTAQAFFAVTQETFDQLGTEQKPLRDFLVCPARSQDLKRLRVRARATQYAATV